MARHWGYRIGGGLLVWVAAALAGADAGLLWAGQDADGFEALGAAIWGFLLGAAVGVAGGILFGIANPPARALHRWLVLGVLAVVAVLSLALQEAID